MSTRRMLLLIDDEPEICEVFTAGFAEAGVDVITAVTPQEVTQLAHTRPFDAILFDVMLPEWGGSEESVRELKRLLGPRTPVICLSGFIDQEMITQARLAGADDFLTMPFDVDIVLEAVLRLCK